ncbi:MAG: HAD-IIIA family hydrolase [Lachnospiraceae bacterium]|nr:HAD-IIIA family hydrolase [Lachnospiraceae bacterium]
MKIPKMILFDYGQTLLDEERFDGVKGTEAVLKYATKNKYNLTAQQVQEAANEINNELGRYNPKTRHLYQVEVPNSMFCPYLYESQGIELSLKQTEIDRVFWDASSPGKPTEGIEEFLEFLKEKGIRTGVISNITYAGEVVAERINRELPKNNFEFIIATSEYLFRKPNKRIFELALEKADLSADEVWYIGDNYNCDVIGARNAGIFPVWYVGALETPYEEQDDVLIVKKWKKLEGLMWDL